MCGRCSLNADVVDFVFVFVFRLFPIYLFEVFVYVCAVMCVDASASLVFGVIVCFWCS